jgi:hypothetical protein
MSLRRSIFARRLAGKVASTWIRVLVMMICLPLLCGGYVASVRPSARHSDATVSSC